MPGWWSIREAEANIQGSAGFGPKQYGRGGGGGYKEKGGCKRVAGQKENEMLPVALIRQAKDTQVMIFHENDRYGDGGRERKKNKECESLKHHLYIKVRVRGPTSGTNWL